MLAAALAAIVLAGIAAGVGREVGRSLRLALPFALLVALVNALVYQEGDTVLFRGGEFLGRRWDVTLEATVAGALNGMRVIVVVMRRSALLSAAVDPDELLRLLRRVSYRSALTASLATRLVPVLARDAARMGDAARCRPQPPGRLAVARAALAGALDRAVDVAAALEVRGYSLGGRSRRGGRGRGRATTCASAARPLAIAGWRPWLARSPGVGAVEAYPTLEMTTGAGRAGARGARCGAGRARAVRGPRGAAGGGACLSRWWSPSASRYRYPEATRPVAARRLTLELEPGTFTVLAGRVGLRQVDAAARALRARAALPRRRGERRAAAWAGSTCATTAPASWPPCAAPSSRSPRRRW